MKNQFLKNMLIETLDYYRYKVINDECTADDMKSIFKAISNGVICDTTIKDLAEFYGQSESNIRNVLSRNIVKKPKREVLYNFFDVSKIIPKRWRGEK